MKIAVCIPAYGDTRAVFTLSLAEMIAHSLKNRPELEIRTFMRSGTLLAWNRNNLVKDALEGGADYLLWLDADHSFPPHTLLSLLSHDREVVACNYAARSAKTFPVAWALDTGTPVITTQEKAQAGGLEEVGGSGLGVCLVRSTVMAALPFPLFDVFRDQSGKVRGEDNYFFRKVRHAGFKVWLDHALSWQIGHVSLTLLTNAHTGRDNDDNTVLPTPRPG